MDLDGALRPFIANDRIPGISYALTDAEGRFAEGALGLRSIESGVAMTPDTVGWIASMTKLVTTTAAMQLVEQGRLSLDSSVQEILPELPPRQVLTGFDADKQPILRPVAAPITLHHLLTHTSGFSYDTWNKALFDYAKANGIPRIGTSLLKALDLPMLFDPGKKYEYGMSTDYVGLMVERASGKSLEQYFRDHIFVPLGVEDINFLLRPDQRQRLAQMHHRQPDGSLEVMEHEVPQKPEFFMGSGGLYGTMPDYVRFLGLFLRGGLGVLKPETIELMFSNRIGEIDANGFPAGASPSSGERRYFPGRRWKWGYGVAVNPEPTAEGRAAYSGTWGGRSNCYFWVDRTRGIAGAVMAQLLPFPDPHVLDAFYAFERAVYN
jgi:methyl acetate hydrolase